MVPIVETVSFLQCKTVEKIYKINSRTHTVLIIKINIMYTGKKKYLKYVAINE